MLIAFAACELKLPAECVWAGIGPNTCEAHHRQRRVANQLISAEVKMFVGRRTHRCDAIV